MSAVLDFRELRDKVLAGEMDEEEEPMEDTGLGLEVKSPRIAIPLCFGVASLGGIAFDKWGNQGTAFSPAWVTGLVALSAISFGVAFGGISRGLEAQTEKERYEKLLNQSQDIIEEQQEEIDAMEAETEEKEAEEQAEAENSYQYDYLSAEDSFFHGPSLGMGVSAFGQEGVLYRPKDTGMPW